MAHVNSTWINFLRQYGPIPRNDNMYDEAIQRIVRRKNITPIVIEGRYVDELLANYTSTRPKSVILTGTAGDGKTYHCRQVWTGLGGSLDDWDAPSKVKTIFLGHLQIKIVKDLTELTDSEQNILVEFAESVIQSNPDTVFLLAANDGQLTEAWKQAVGSLNTRMVGQAIEDMLVAGMQDHSELSLRMYNLSHIDSSWALPRIVKNMLHHPGWQECLECSFRDNEDLSQRCPIWENRQRIEGSFDGGMLLTRLVDLLALCEINGFHLPIRQLLLLVTNMLLGHPDARDRLMICQDVPKILGDNSASRASVYRNIFGENLTERKRETIEVFATLGRFGIGNESSNRIDNVLIFGVDDPALKSFYQDLVVSDPYYGADHRYIAEQKSYLEGTLLDEGRSFLLQVRSQRQRLFFTIPAKNENDLKLWELTTFHYAGEFLNQVYRPLITTGLKISSQITTRLVRGLNRIFTGLLTRTQDELFLATSGSNSQAKVSKIFEESISVRPRRGESVSLTHDGNGSASLEVSLSLSKTIQPVSITMNLMRFEFLSRVADGALPGSFSRECYEDILAFKSRLLRQLTKRRAEENEPDLSDSRISFQILKLTADGELDKKSVEVNL